MKSNGAVWVWGDNGDGQLGDGGTSDHNSPVQVLGLLLPTPIHIPTPTVTPTLTPTLTSSPTPIPTSDSTIMAALIPTLTQIPETPTTYPTNAPTTTQSEDDGSNVLIWVLLILVMLFGVGFVMVVSLRIKGRPVDSPKTCIVFSDLGVFRDPFAFLFCSLTLNNTMVF